MKTNKHYSILGNKEVSGFTIGTVLDKHFDTLKEAQEMLKIYNDMALGAPKQAATFKNKIVIVISNETNGEFIEVQELPKKGRA